MLISIFCEDANTINEPLISCCDTTFSCILTLFIGSMLLTVFVLKRSTLVTLEGK